MDTAENRVNFRSSKGGSYFILTKGEEQRYLAPGMWKAVYDGRTLDDIWELAITAPVVRQIIKDYP